MSKCYECGFQFEKPQQYQNRDRFIKDDFGKTMKRKVRICRNRLQCSEREMIARRNRAAQGA